MGQASRAAIAHTIFELLAKEKAPFIVIGNLGFAVSSCLRLLIQFEEDYGIKLKDQVQIIYTIAQQLVCMFKREKPVRETKEFFTNSRVSQH